MTLCLVPRYGTMRSDYTPAKGQGDSCFGLRSDKTSTASFTITMPPNNATAALIRSSN